MKKTLLIATALIATALGADAQTMHVRVGNVDYAFSADETGEMTFAGGSALTIQGKTFSIADITSISVDNTSIADNTVSVAYNGSTASVTVAGNVAKNLTVAVENAQVSITADSELAEKIAYTLSGSSTSGSFAMSADIGATLNLNSLSLTSQNGAAINIDDGKKINVNLTGTNTLTDAANGSQKACLYIDGHAVIAGTGSLTITGNTSHAYFSDEYTEMESGTLTIAKSVNDGMHVNQYFRIDGGTINITAGGDGIDVGAKNKAHDQNGQMILAGGTINVTSTGAGSKALKADSAVTVSGGTFTALSEGSAYYDTEEADISSPAVLKCKGAFTMTSGSLNLTATGAGGRGINADGNVTVEGGELTVITAGNTYEYGDDDSKPQGIKTDGNITVNGGTVHVAASPSNGNAMKTDFTIAFNGGTIMAIGDKRFSPSGSQGYRYYKGESVRGGQTVTKDGVSWTLPTTYPANSDAKIIVSAAGIN